jgi:hypothetical protein
MLPVLQRRGLSIGIGQSQFNGIGDFLLVSCFSPPAHWEIFERVGGCCSVASG